MKKAVLILLVMCSVGLLNAQIKVVLEQDIDRLNTEAQQAKVQKSRTRNARVARTNYYDNEEDEANGSSSVRTRNNSAANNKELTDLQNKLNRLSYGNNVVMEDENTVADTKKASVTDEDNSANRSAYVSRLRERQRRIAAQRRM